MANQDVIDSILGEEYSSKNKEIAQAIEKVEIKEKIEVKVPKGEKTKEVFKPGAGVDVGTSNIVVSRQKEDGTFVHKFHRNMLYPLDVSEESEDLLERSDYHYVKVNDKYFIIGEDALRLVNALGKGEVIRPMKDGILNPSLKESSQLLFYIIKAVVGEPLVEKESLRFSIPANPIDQNLNNTFHKMILQNFFTQIGYDAKPVNEAMCIVYDCNPVMKSDEGNTPLTGFAISCGAGMANICCSLKGMELSSFSVTKSGDYIDEQASIVTGVQKSKIIKRKEKELDLADPDMSDMVLSALKIYYYETIERVVALMAKEFSNKGTEMEGGVEIIVAGGTSMPKGYCSKFEEAVKNNKFPFKIYRVRHSATPFFSVAQGACARAQADWSKKS